MEGGGKCDAFSPYTVYLGLSKHLYRLHRTEKALAYYRFLEDFAKTRARGATVLHNRGLLNAEMGNMSEAREDINQAVVLDPLSLDIRYASAFLLFQENKYEEALMDFYRGYKERKQPDYFAEGILMARGVIEDSVGYKSGPWSDQNILGKTLLNMKLKELNISPSGKPKSQADAKTEMNKLEKKKKKYAKNFLGLVAIDKECLADYVNNPSLSVGNEANYKWLQSIASETLKRLQVKEESLWKRRPIYSINYQLPDMSPKLQREQHELQESRRQSMDRYMLRRLYKLYELVLDRRWTECQRLGLSLREILLGQSERTMPGKRTYLKTLYFLLGEMYLSMKYILKRWNRTNNDRRILQILGIPGNNDSFAELCKESFHAYIPDINQYMKNTQESLKYSDDHLELAYLSHEMGCCYSSLDRSDTTRSYARDCITESKKAGNIIWYLNGVFLLARTEVQSCNLMEAKVTLAAARATSAKFRLSYVAEFADRAITLLNRENEAEMRARTSVQSNDDVLMNVMVDNEYRCKAEKIIQTMNNLTADKRMALSPRKERKEPNKQAAPAQVPKQQTSAEIEHEIREKLSRRMTFRIEDEYFNFN